MAVVTCSDGSVVYSVFSGRVREPNLAPTDIRVSVGSIQVCAAFLSARAARIRDATGPPGHACLSVRHPA